MENRKKHALNHLKPYIFGASVLKKDDREIREIEIFLDRLTPHPCFVGLRRPLHDDVMVTSLMKSIE